MVGLHETRVNIEMRKLLGPVKSELLDGMAMVLPVADRATSRQERATSRQARSVRVSRVKIGGILILPLKTSELLVLRSKLQNAL